MTRLSPRAHGHALVLLLAHRVIAASFIGYPLSKIVGAAGIARFPDGDRLLWEAGGTHLVELLRVGGPYLAASGMAMSTLFVALSASALLPLSALVVALDEPIRPPLGHWAGRSVGALPAFVFLAGLTILCQLLLLLGGASAAVGLRSALSSGTSERFADLSAAAVGMVTLVLVAAVGVVEDLGRAEVVRTGATGTRVVGPALEAAIASPRASFLGWGARATGTVVLVAAAAGLVEVVDVGAEGTGRLAGAWAIHLTALAASVLLRASWMARALDVMALRTPTPPATGEADDTAARSVAPAGPSRDPAS